MQNSSNILRATTLAAIATLTLASCGDKPSSGVSPQAMADAIHTVLEADRTVYTRLIVNRLANEENVITASEHWQEEKALLLPAQMFRAGAELSREKGANFSYALLSIWPINKQNKPQTEAEKTGLQFVADNPQENYYAEETLGDTRYFTAVYPDIAVVDACVTCHNNHKDSPKTDFELNDVMGGVVIRIPL
ncbi:MAG: DUF3365 domain-containing protein [Chromatiales bacterium]|jgi:hypothetical protein